jgi:predicted dehydrogenase
MKTEKVRVGLISFDHVHAEFRSRALAELADSVQIVAIAEAEEERGRDAVSRFGGIYFSDYRRLLEEAKADLIFIHSANDQHKEIVVDTVRAGKAVFCEKPLATSYADALTMTLAAERAEVPNTVGFCSRYIPEAERAKQIIGQGLLGKIINVHATIGLAGIREIGCPAHMADWMEEPTQGGGGALMDEGAHAFDLLHWLVGDIVSIFSQVENRAKPTLNVEDNATSLLRFKDGGLGSLTTLWSMQIDIGMRNVLQIFGDEGSLFLELTSATPKVSLYSEKVAPPYLAGWTVPQIKPVATEPHDYRSWPVHVQHYKREVNDIIYRFQNGIPFQATFRDGLKVAAVTEAAYQSARSNTFVSVVPNAEPPQKQ